MATAGPSPAMNLGVQSFCFRHIVDNHQVASKVRRIGVESIEICDVHCDFSEPSSHGSVIAAYREAGVGIVSIGVQSFTNQPAIERHWFEFAQAAGAKCISAHFQPDSYLDALPAAEKLCEEFGIRLAIHNHGGYQWHGSADMLEHLLSISSPRIGLCLDTAWCLQAGEDPLQWVRRFGDRLYGIHYKDFVFDRAGKWKDVIVGAGNLDLPALLKAADAAGFDGYGVIEYEADADNPQPALTRCVQQMRAAGAKQ